ncbi:MAG TPA: hypothetical protein VLA88_02855 [Candidatus Saccharimonadales bacterium]|nr:hypothetical protein [Candidatus Saccharimonadales bacterium]
MKKAAGWIFLAGVIAFIGFNPNDASVVFESLGSTIADIARGFGTFFTNLAT